MVLSEDPRDAAARWFVRLQDGALDSAERADFEAWLAAPVHRDEFEALQRLWGAADLIPAQRLRQLAADEPIALRPRAGKRRWPAFAAAACVAGLAAGVALFGGWGRDYSAEFHTALGERRQVELPDGSYLELNGDTHLKVRLGDERRSVSLERGEAMFSVAHASQRPFVVDAGLGEVTVTGTRFDVRRDADEVRVAVEQGRVRVAGRDATTAEQLLTAGLATRIDAEGRVAPAAPADVAAQTAWRDGRLVFNGATLAEVVREVSRYRAKPVSVVSPEAAKMRLTSVFRVDDTDALLAALPHLLPVRVQTLADGSNEIILR
ncbi:FecR family protein [Pseudomonas citronellolis]|uniref:FecR family protein n=1 Tax=Pseudomonas citronellolis TaxID=53408 RepID=UPI0023E36ACC|nr:FecR family protein [Pseudomonas citronellolis]MDF3934467.1 FecR family protein [Pseudomonas citronellolis]